MTMKSSLDVFVPTVWIGEGCMQPKIGNTFFVIISFEVIQLRHDVAN